MFLTLTLGICRRGVSSSSAVKVTPGENVTLHCDLSRSTEMFWYRHIGHELTMIISATTGNLDKELAVNYNTDPEHFQSLTQSVRLKKPDYCFIFLTLC